MNLEVEKMNYSSMEIGNVIKVCVTGASGYIGSSLIKKLLEKGYFVHGTLRDLGDESKTSFLRSFPMSETRLKLFQADIYNPQEFEESIKECRYVLHVATPMSHTQNSKYKDTIEAAIAGIKSIADACLRSNTVKRLVCTSSVMAASPLREDGNGYKPQMDELCWTPLNLSCTSYGNYSFVNYTYTKTLSEIEALKYNVNLSTENSYDDELEVVSLGCGLVGGETLLSHVSSSLLNVVAQLKGDQLGFDGLRFLQGLLGSIPMVHIEDVCEAHIFCIEKSSLCGRFLCAAESCTVEEMTTCYEEIRPELPIVEGFERGPEGRCKCELSKLRDEGYEFKYGLKDILNDSVECAKRLGYL